MSEIVGKKLSARPSLWNEDVEEGNKDSSNDFSLV